MIADREQIHLALFNKVKGLVGAKTVSRRLKGWTDVPKSEQPAVFVVKGNEQVMRQTGLPAHYALDFAIWIYVKHESQSVIPSSILDGFYAQVETMLASPAGLQEGKQTLGGLVHDCRVEGTIETDEGWLGDQAVAKIPIKILTT
ncbi:MAG: hypothetical protein HGB04_03990 [Chlorobiaceae bacterium]|nr:hypothetical protein [Chlorobiaceae bacterium]